MCIVIDANTFHCVFESSSKCYEDFEPVDKWLHSVLGSKLVYGGSRYRQELSRLTKYLPYLSELKRSHRIAEIDDASVDAKESELTSKIGGNRFNDTHILAIFVVSGCRLFCSRDKSADKYLRNRRFYPKGQRPPHIYRSRKHIGLLCSKNIVALRNLKQ